MSLTLAPTLSPTLSLSLSLSLCEWSSASAERVRVRKREREVRRERQRQRQRDSPKRFCSSFSSPSSAFFTTETAFFGLWPFLSLSLREGFEREKRKTLSRKAKGPHVSSGESLPSGLLASPPSWRPSVVCADATCCSCMCICVCVCVGGCEGQELLCMSR